MDMVINIASCISEMYRNAYGKDIDEMKMHKLLYLAQRESLIRTDQPLFSGEFYAWRFGPVLNEVRQAYRNGTLPVNCRFSATLSEYVQSVLVHVFSKYSQKDSWSLSRLTHAEYSWQAARARKNSGGAFRLMPINDIRIDAQRIAKRRQMLRNLGLGAI